MIYTDLFKLREDMAKPGLPSDRQIIRAALQKYSDATWHRWTECDSPGPRAALLDRAQAIDELLGRLE